MTRLISFLAGALVVLLLPGAALSAEAGPQGTSAWREARDERLRKPDGWLSLVGLHWLQPGRHTLGSSSDNDIVLAAGPGRLGTLTVADGTVELCPTDPSVTVDGEVVTCAPLASDAEESYSLVESGSMRFYVLDREGRLGLRVKDGQAPTLLAYPGMDYFPYDPAWNVSASFEPHPPGRVMEIPNVIGTVARIDNPGRIVFDRGGETHAIEAVRYEGDDELFLIFADRTNGKSTYGAGRFLYTSLPDEAGRVAVDFNQSYNPPCVFTDYATCPLPPPENRLRVAIEAGEKDYALGDH